MGNGGWLAALVAVPNIVAIRLAVRDYAAQDANDTVVRDGAIYVNKGDAGGAGIARNGRDQRFGSDRVRARSVCLAPLHRS